MIIRHVYIGVGGFPFCSASRKALFLGTLEERCKKGTYPHGSNNNLFLALWVLLVKLEACFCCSVMYMCIVEWRVIITTMYYYLLSRRKSLVMGTERTMDGHYGATNFNFA